ncbi:hypothetical protein KQI36_06035 [Clostridium senegalense]|uniref:hypothetical protein n=1 Tax=Clostridium senegalense TaxID=1465809 RepID=UPI001C1107F5|nr:hypothetical protein [Clostridium senegalense]MBU5226207.1 hypothetical protein [Clostridium senegalense]
MKDIINYFFGIKRFISILLTITFCILSIKGNISGEQFVTIFAVIISFYFGQSTARKAISDTKSMIGIDDVSKLGSGKENEDLTSESEG